MGGTQTALPLAVGGRRLTARVVYEPVVDAATGLLMDIGPAPMLDTPAAVVKYMADAWDPMREAYWVVGLNTRNRAIARMLLGLGTASSVLAGPRETLVAVLRMDATAFVVVHNHPAGDPSPSTADTRMTREIRVAAEAVGVKMHDHVIVGDPSCDPLGLGYYSFQDAGLC